MAYILKNVFSKSPKVIMIDGKNVIGNCAYSIINDTNACINNLYIEPEYRNNDNGSCLLRYTENILETKYNIKTTSLLAYEPETCNLRIFFQKNGYSIDDSKKIETFDDGQKVFNLIPMIKNIK